MRDSMDTESPDEPGSCNGVSAPMMGATRINQEILMNMINIRTKASLLGINHGRLLKTELIKIIQIVEGHFDCYATANHGECDQANCLWRDDCFEAAPPKENYSGELS